MGWYGSCIDIAIGTQGLKRGLVWLMYRHSDRNSRSDSAAGYGSCINIAIETQGLKCGLV